ncbi:hypothetical protein [Desulfobulbus alkaliphilus]|uniref:hypothetical protein n=1 Tax=Desulfobulbus alkaliphilus TaxID=869814 RepID=UPI001962411D|nr:hypothetical protein [Desulfobulbus alkaliphilus]MBM9536229.1 hypothetical protein [Desulfobulbus alkaliphilus]
MTCRTMMFRVFPLILLAFMAFQPWIEAGEQIPGQKPMPFIEGAFQFTPGAWADYVMYDKTKQQGYRMRFATLTREYRQGRTHIWMEIGIEIPDQPRVATRILAEETTAGPGEIREVIVQMDGHKPFNVPKSFLKDSGKEVGRLQPFMREEKPERRTVTRNDRSFDVWHVQAVDAQGLRMTAEVSEFLPPLGIYRADTAEINMRLVDHGLGAKTAIQGEPMSLWLWIMDQVGSAFSTEK